MVEVPAPKTEFSDQPFFKPTKVMGEERDLGELKKKIGYVRDFVIFTGCKYPWLVHVDNRTEFIKKIIEEGCGFPERTIDRAIRLALPFFESKEIDTGRDRSKTMQEDHRLVFGEMKQ